MPSEAEKELLLRVADGLETRPLGWGARLPLMTADEARTISRVLREAAEGWQDITKGAEASDLPTDEMIEAGEEEIAERRSCGCRVYAADIWRAMEAVRPLPPPPAAGGKNAE